MFSPNVTSGTMLLYLHVAWRNASVAEAHRQLPVVFLHTSWLVIRTTRTKIPVPM